MTAKLYSLLALTAAKRNGSTPADAVRFSRHVATELDQDGELAPSVAEARAAHLDEEALATIAEYHAEFDETHGAGKASAILAAAFGIPVPTVPAVRIPAGKSPEHWDGVNYKKHGHLDVAEVAKRLRQEVKDEVKKGTLPKAKYSFRVSRYAGGQSINLTVSGIPTTFPLLNPEHVEAHRLDPHYSRPHTMPRYTAQGSALIKKLDDLGDSYRYDRSDTQSDSFCTNFYYFVSIDSDTEQAHRTAIG